MNICIYCQKSEPEVNFISQDHIIPAGLGGITELPKGYVCDQCNNKFSAIEKHFQRDSIISLGRMFMGPGKRGKLAPKYASESNVHLMIFAEDIFPKKGLGVIKSSAPYLIDQIYLKGDTHGICLSPSSRTKDQAYNEFANRLKSFDGKYVDFFEEKMDTDEYIIGHHDSRFFICHYPTADPGLALAFIEKFKSAKGWVVKDTIEAKTQVQSQLKMHLSIDAFLRVYAKIAFNCLASLRGSEYVNSPMYDPVRNWILNGGEGNFVQFSQDNPTNDNLAKVPFPMDSHKVFIEGNALGVFGYITLYGYQFSTTSRLSTTPDNMFGGRVCDWRNRKDLDLVDCVHEITKKESLE